MKKLILLTILIGCAGRSQENKVLEQSMTAHELALKTSKEVLGAISELERRKETLGDSLKSVLADSIQNLRADWSDWEASIVEVPGHDHAHHDHDHHDHGDHDHNHDHSPSPDLTPEMVLEIQQELVAGINRLDQRAQQLLDGTENK